MVCLNENIKFNVKTLKNNLILKMKNFIDGCDHFLNEKNILYLKTSIEKEIKDLFYNDHFIDMNMDESLCSFKHKRGSNNGYFCCKKIKTNLQGQKKDYLCSKHSRRHIPKKRKIKQTNIPTTVTNSVEDKSFKVEPILAKNNISSSNLDENKNKIDTTKKDIDKNIKKINNGTRCHQVIYNKDKILNAQKEINKKNIYKNNILNYEHNYEILFKEFYLMDFVINKIKKNKHNYIKLNPILTLL